MKYILTFLCAVSVFQSAFADIVFGSAGLKAGTKLQDIKQPAGNWIPAKHSWKTVAGGGCSSVWKGCKSRFNFTKPHSGLWRLEFMVKILPDAKYSVLIWPRTGKDLPWLRILADGTLIPSYRNIRRPIPAEQFKFPQNEWTQVWLELYASPKGKSYSVGSGDKVLLKNIPLPSTVPHSLDGVELWGDSNGNGGNKILLDNFRVIPKTVEKLPVSLQLKPLNGDLEYCFVSGTPVKFAVTLKNYIPSPGAKINWSLLTYYAPQKNLAVGEIKPDSSGAALLNLPADLKKQTYRLKLEFHGDVKKKLLKEYSFAVLSPPPEPPADVTKEYFGVDTMEMHPAKPCFNKDMALFELLGIRHLRVWSLWSWYHPAGKPPQLEQKRLAAERFVKAGIQWVEDIQSSPEWASAAPANGTNRWKYPPKDWKHYDTYINALTSVLGARASYQVWCEPVSWMSVDQIESQYPDGLLGSLAQYMIRTGKAVRKNAPGSTFMGPANCSALPEWTSLLLRKYGTHFNAISYHYPKWPNTPRSTNQRIRRDIVRYADKLLPQYTDEAESYAGAAPDAENDQILRLKRDIEQWAEGLCLRAYHYMFRHPRIADVPRNFYFSRDFQPSGGVGVLQTAISQLRNAEFVAKKRLPGNIMLYYYKKVGKLCAAAWSDGNAAPLPEKIFSASGKIFDRYGNELSREGFKLGKAPVYLNDLAPLPEVLLQMRPENVRLDSDLAFPMKFTIGNFTAGTVSGKLKFEDAYASFKPAQISLSLPPGTVRSIDVTVQPRAGKCDFRRRPVTAVWNGRKITVGEAQYFNTTQVKVFRAADFAKAADVWQKPTQEYLHSNLAKNFKAWKSTDVSAVKGADGIWRGEFFGHIPPRPKENWLGLFYPCKPQKLPGIPFKMRMKARATPKTLPSTTGLLFRFCDAKGKVFQYGLSPWLWPGREGETLVCEAGIDSPVSQAHRHSQWGGGDPDALTYPLHFLGFSINPSPQRNRQAEWFSKILVETIEFDCYIPQDPVNPVPQIQDNTNQF